jgi:HAD superfamily hydrolase (TIGR01509 family)
MRALVFDFDELILDTETSVYEAWRIVYEEHDQVLPRDRWLSRIGTDGSAFDPLVELCARVGENLDAEEIRKRRMAYHRAHLEGLDQMPGVRACLEHARAKSIGTAIASSSPFYWVSGHIERLGLTHFFDQIVTAEHVDAAKPAPDLYLRATELLGVDPVDAIALEDSPNGVRSAKAAGLYCIAVPGPMTRTLSFEAADSVMASLDARPAGEWIAQAAAARDARNANQQVISSR